MNIYWESGINDIQKSPNLFITNLVNNDTLKLQYPEILTDFTGSKIIDVQEYVQDDTVDTNDKSLTRPN